MEDLLFMYDTEAAERWLSAQVQPGDVQRVVKAQGCQNRSVVDLNSLLTWPCLCGGRALHTYDEGALRAERASVVGRHACSISAYHAMRGITPQAFLEQKRGRLAVYAILEALTGRSASWPWFPEHTDLSGEAWTVAQRLVCATDADKLSDWCSISLQQPVDDAAKQRLVAAFGVDVAETIQAQFDRVHKRGTELLERQAASREQVAAAVELIGARLTEYCSANGYVQAAKLMKALGVGSKYGDEMSVTVYRAALTELGAERMKTTIKVPEGLRP